MSHRDEREHLGGALLWRERNPKGSFFASKWQPTSGITPALEQLTSHASTSTPCLCDIVRCNRLTELGCLSRPSRCHGVAR